MLAERQDADYGVVAQVRCGLQLRIGHVCGRKHIEGFEEIDALARRLEDHARDTRSLGEQPRALLAFYEWIREASRPYIALQNKTLRDVDPEIVKEIHRRRSLEGGQRAEVLVRGEPDLEGKREDYQRALDLDFMFSDADTPKILGDHRDVQSFISRVATGDMKSRKAVRELVKEQTRLNERRQHYERWLASAGAFFARQNLELLVYATHEPTPMRTLREVTGEHEATIVKLLAAYSDARAKAGAVPRPS